MNFLGERLKNQSFIPVILGGNIGAYGIARSFHEAYSINSIIMSTVSTGPVRNSAIVFNLIEPNMKKISVIKERLAQIEEHTLNVPKILIGSDDWHVEMIIQLKSHLSEEWIIPYISQELFEKLTNKSEFYKFVANWILIILKQSK
ncbi:hypothetical protein ER45_027885 (plasmid) [Bacillus mycoides]|nr:hypothetical protein ER45_027885 [Bacillus mycoides]